MTIRCQSGSCLGEEEGEEKGEGPDANGDGLEWGVRALRAILTILYASYLVNMGILLIMLPWSEVWAHALLLMPMRLAVLVDIPAVRGVISAFGVLHLLLLVAEFFHPTLVNPPGGRRLT